MIFVRSSKADQAGACAASTIPPAVRIESADNYMARLGSAAHACFSARINGTEPVTSFIATEFDVEADELGASFGQLWSAWKSVAEYFPNPRTDVAHEPVVHGACGVTLTGTSDVEAVLGDGSVAVLDFKTGFLEGVHKNQMRSYCLMACRDGGYHAATATLLRSRYRSLETFRWSRDELETWWDGFARDVAREQNVFRPSPAACQYCQRGNECPARTQLVRSATEMVLQTPSKELTPDYAVQLVERARLLKAVCERVIETMRGETLIAGGAMPAGSDGRRLKINTKEKRHIVAEKASDILYEALGDRLIEATSYGKGAVEELARSIAPQGLKGKRAKELIERLEQAGAIDITTEDSLVIENA